MVDALSLESYRADVSELLRRCCAEWSKMPPEVWAEEVFRLPDGRRFDWSYAPFAKGMFLSIFDQSASETVLQLFSRGLKSTVVLLAIGYTIDQAPRRILSLWPTNSQAEKWSKDILVGELFDTTPPLNYLGSKNTKRTSSNTLLHKSFAGGLIDIFGANAPGDMRRAKGSFLYGDEIDAIGETTTDEGDQLAIFNKRGDEYPDTIRVFASYPSVKGRSRINAKLEESDWQQWKVTCAICGGEPFVMHRSQIRYPKNTPAEARLECPRCTGHLDDRQRHEMMLAGRWIATRPFTGRHGFQANAMLWPHPTDPVKTPGGFLQMIAQAEIDASKSDNPKRSLRVLVNTVDAEPYEAEEESEKRPDLRTIMDRREDYGDASGKIVVPSGALVLTAGVDVHKNRLEVEWTGFGRSEESWGLDHVVIAGEVQDVAVWAELKRELSRKFIHESGAQIGLTMAFIDAGKWPDWVYAFLRDVPLAGKIRACRGSSQFPHPLVDVTYKSIAKQLKGHWVGGDEAKDLIYTRLRLQPDEEGLFPPGYMHFHKGYSDTFFQQLTSEKVSIEYVKGEEIRRYKNTDHVRNEALDVKVYALAAYRLRRSYPFAQIEQELEESALKIKDGTPSKPAPAKAVTARRQGGFVGAWR